MSLPIISRPFGSRFAANMITGVAAFAIAAAIATVPADAKRASKKVKNRDHTGPLTLMVSLKRQRVVVFDKDGAVTSAPISSGARGHRTPTGIFSILQKRRRHYSNLYRGAAMPNMQRITWSGIALHAGHLPGYPASHGCIRLPYSFSKKLFGMTEMGTRVVVTHEQAAPQSFAHDALFKPLPAGDPDKYAEPGDDDGEKTKADAGSSAAEMLFGISSANAREDAGLPEGIERTRAAVAAYRRLEIDKLGKAVEASTAAHLDAADKLKTANAELAQAYAAQRELQKSSQAITQRLRKAESALAAVNRNFRALYLRAASLTEAEAGAKAELEEDALEAEALRHLAEIDLAEADRAALDQLVKERQAAADKAKEHRDTLNKRYIVAQKALIDLKRRLKQAESAFERRQKPITILLSKHDGKLYVRQGYDPIYETDITFKQPDAPIGTHFYHALEWNEDGSDLNWQAVTAARKYASKTKRSKNRKSRDDDVAGRGPPQTPGNALERANIPEEAREFLAEHLKPGSAVIISDERKSYETGKYTDLIVTTR